MAFVVMIVAVLVIIISTMNNDIRIRNEGERIIQIKAITLFYLQIKYLLEM